MKEKNTSSLNCEEDKIKQVKVEKVKWGIFSIRLTCVDLKNGEPVEIILRNVDIPTMIFLGLGIIGWVVLFLS